MFTAPLGSVKPDSGLQQHSGSIPATVYDRSDEVFDKKIYLALGFRWDTETPEARREICSFASVWHKARQLLSGLPPPALDELGRRAIAEAGKIAKRRGNHNKAAVWCIVFDKLMNARLAEAM